MKTDRLLSGGAVLALALASNAASAQQSPTKPHDAGSLNEIVVTAQKREQKLQDVGLTVTALSAKALETQRIASIGDLAKIVPGLNFTPSPNSTPVYTLRGVGFFETSVAAYPDVTVYLDQAPLPLPAMSALTAFDLERVEVLKGPQGTLFGNNATGGAIDFVAAKPKSTPEGAIELGYSRFGTFDVQGHVSGPLTDTLKARLAVKATESDDWQHSYTRHDTIGAADRVAARLLLDWTPSDRLHVTLDANGWHDGSDPQVPQLKRQTMPSDLQIPIGTVGLTGAITPAFPLLHYPAAPHDATAADWDPAHRPFADDSLWQIFLNGTYQLTDAITLTSLTNYVKYSMRNATEGDGTALAALDITRDDADAETFTQELRLSNTGKRDRFRWIVGANYDHTTVNEGIDLLFPYASSGAQQGFSADSYSSDQRLRNIAGFGNVEFDVTSDVTLKGGIRYTDSDRMTTNESVQTPGYVELPGSPGLVNFINFVWGDIYTPAFCPGVTYKPIGISDSVSIDPKTCVAGAYRGELDERSLSWSGGVDYKPWHGILLYANVSKGYKAGSFPTVSAATWAQYAPVKQESVIDYEVGFKTQLSRQVSVNGAAFYYDYTDKQVRGKTVDPLFGTLDQLVNVPKSHIEGGELELNWHPISGLSTRLAATYLDAKVDSYDGVVGSSRNALGLAFPILTSFQNVDLPFAPNFQAAAAADYDFPVSDAVWGFVGGTVTGQTESYGSLQLAPQDRADATIPGYAILDLRAGIEAADEHWKLTVWGKNVTNTFYVTNSLRAYDTIIQYTGRPAEYGVTLGWKF